MCKSNDGLTFGNQECYLSYNDQFDDRIWINCLNREDKRESMFNSPIFAKNNYFPPLKSVLDFNTTGFFCEDSFIRWQDLDGLRGSPKTCKLKGIAMGLPTMQYIDYFGTILHFQTLTT